MGWQPTRTPGSSLWRFRVWVTGGAAALALIWMMLAVWRTVSAQTPQFAVLLIFALVNMAAVGRVVFPGKKARVRTQAGDAAGRPYRRGAAVLTAVTKVVLRGQTAPAVAHASLPPRLASYLGVYEDGAPPAYQPIAGFTRAVSRQPNLGRLLQRLGPAVRDLRSRTCCTSTA